MTVSTEIPSRRAALGALASVPVLALPVGAITASVADAAASQDADLFALISSARDLNERNDAAHNACAAAFERTEKIPMPQLMIATEANSHIWPIRVGEPFNASDIKFFKDHLARYGSAQSGRRLPRAAREDRGNGRSCGPMGVGEAPSQTAKRRGGRR